MAQVVKSILALLDGCDLVKSAFPLKTSKREFISEVLLKKHPVYIVSLDEDGVAHEIQPHALGFYLSDLLVRDLQDKALVLMVFAEGFDSRRLLPYMSALVIADGEVVEFSVEDSFEIASVFALLKERMETADGDTA